LATFERVIGPPRSVVKTKADSGLLLAPKFPQRPQFIALDRVDGMNATFEPPNVQMALRKIDLIPA
jgi:hypothetical protein